MARYYGKPYNDQEQENVAKRNYQTDQVQEELFPRFVQKKDYSGYGRVSAEKAQGYWNLLKALEEELALERMSKQDMEDDGILLFHNYVGYMTFHFYLKFKIVQFITINLLYSTC